MLYRYDGSGGVEEVNCTTYPSPQGPIKVYRIGNVVLLEAPDNFGIFKKKLKEETLPRILQLLGLPVKVKTPKESERSGKHEQGITRRPQGT